VVAGPAREHDDRCAGVCQRRAQPRAGVGGLGAGDEQVLDRHLRVDRIVADPDHRLSVGAEVTVQHVLVAGSETADTQPRLRPALVQPGAPVIVLARWSGDHWAGVDEHHGLVVADAAHRAALPVR
jgi:hypothetical protein